MNEAVDFNLLRFLCLLIMLAADMCFSFKDYKRAFYFFHEAVRLVTLRPFVPPTPRYIRSRWKP